ncbi:MAG: hypothetical protein ACRENB_12195 [Gemmatimonadales bacterium]
MRYLVAVGTVAAKGRAELAQQFHLPGLSVSHQTFLTAVRGMLEKATAQKELLVSVGMSDSLLEALAKAVSEFEATLEANRTGRRDHVGASTDLQAVATEIVGQVRVLDGLVTYRFGDSSELMGAWKSARNVFGPSRIRGRAGDSGEGDEPSLGPGDVAPAA